MSYASVTNSNGETFIVSTGELTIPLVGLWTATVDVPQSETSLLGETVTLTVADLDLVGTVVGGGVYQGTGSYRLVGGKGGWRQVIPWTSYAGPLARLATIAEDAARLVGETVRTDVDKTVGPYVRTTGPAARVLALAPSWFVDVEGVTVIGTRPNGLLSPRILDARLRSGVVEISEEEIAAIQPGKSVDVEGLGEVSILCVAHNLSGGSKLYT